LSCVILSLRILRQNRQLVIKRLSVSLGCGH